MVVYRAIFFASQTYHLSRTPQHSCQGKNRPSLCLQNVLVTLLVGLNHTEGNTRKFGQFLLGETGLLPNGFQHVFAGVQMRLDKRVSGLDKLGKVGFMQGGIK